LSALINNAAQTLTDSVKKEERAMKREDDLRKRITHREFLIDGGYKARVRGRELPMRLKSTPSISVPALEAPGGHTVTNESADTNDPSHETTAQLEPYTKSSWVQSISEIPYEDVGSALSVNTFVPFILCRELLPLMGNTTTDRSNDTAIPSKPQGYIINVSSREGVFETHTSSPAKRGKHVHTNMSKAALNMLTETEAETAWRGRRVAMNTVDPGYMSAAPEYEDAFEGVRPIGWEDGAGRVLWPIAAAEIGKQVVWGRFLKHYGAVEGEASRG
jgi:NAD(P)-dependent dehydrogenase (short-subunit alcohol dehydrogenase family)